MPAFDVPQRPSGEPAAASDLPLASTLWTLMDRRGLTLASLCSLLRAEGIAISRARLHQLGTGSGAPPSAEQLERLASVLGVSPSYFAEYRLWRARATIDPSVVGFERAMANFDRLRGRRDVPAAAVEGAMERPRYPGAVTSESEER